VRAWGELKKVLSGRSLPPQPKGSADDWDWIFLGRRLNHAEVTAIESLLSTYPDSLALRLLLLGYRSGLAYKNSQVRSFRHAIWMIDNRPADYISSQLVHLGNLTKVMRQKTRDHWLVQTKANRQNALVYCNASEYFDGEESRRLLRKAMRLDPAYAVPIRRLAQKHRALSLWGPVVEREKNARRALRLADKALALNDKYGERIGMLTEFTHVAIRYDDLERAQRFAAELLNEGRKSKMHHWMQYALIYLARIAVAQQSTQGELKKLLASLIRSLRAHHSHVGYGDAMLLLLEDLLRANEVAKALVLFEIGLDCLRGPNAPSDKLAQWRVWLRDVSGGGLPKLGWKKKRRRLR
jgi:hypothetical protein